MFNLAIITFIQCQSQLLRITFFRGIVVICGLKVRRVQPRFGIESLFSALP